MPSAILSRLTICLFLLWVVLICTAPAASAWTEHPLISYQVLSSLPEVCAAKPVRAEPLEAFLYKEKKGVAETLADVEAWAKGGLPWYQPLPPPLTFKDTVDPKDIKRRFCQAIRVNPTTQFPLYLQLLPDQQLNATPISLQQLTPLKDTTDWKGRRFAQLRPGEIVSPLLVVTSATDEPDLGLDIGLYEDNGTPFGKIYGFGRQPFGNPNLEYGSQAPFHMGFYHEAWIVKALAGFVKKTYPEYRIYLYQRLARLAFATGHDYWGWRFLGIGLHYVMDLTQPYHTTLMPGAGVPKMLGIAVLSLVGIDGPKKEATQLLSNRHTVFEKLVQQLLEEAYLKKDSRNPIFVFLRARGKCPRWHNRTPRDLISAYSNERAAKTDKLIRETLPERLTQDPTFEVAKSVELKGVLALTRKKAGEEGVEKLEGLVAELLAPLPSYTCSYVRSVLGR